MEAGVVTPEQVDEGLVRQRSTGLRIGETLVEMGAATEEDIGWALARQLALPFVDPHPEALDRDLIRSFPEGLLQRLDVLPLVSEESALSIALADPTDADLVEEVERAAGRQLTLSVATPSAIQRMLQSVLGPRHDPRALKLDSVPDAQFDVQWDRSGASFLLFHINQARRAQASEVHFLLRAGSLDVHHRIGGTLVRAASDPPGALYYLLGRIEALGGPVLDDRTVHAYGQVLCPFGDTQVRIGVSLLHQEEGVSATLQIEPLPEQAPDLEELGFEPVDLAALRGMLDGPAGIAIVGGPPRNGGSTTLSSMLTQASTAGRRCIAFGVPPSLAPAEIRVSGSIADAARVWSEAVVAQSADVVALDGVLTGDSVTEALRPEAAGRLLLMRTNWTDSFALLEALMTAPSHRVTLADRLRVVVQQRLPRTASAAGRSAALPVDRRGAFEVLFVTDALRAAIRAGEPMAKLRTCAESGGFRPLAARLQALVDSGEISPTEAERMLA